MRWYVSENKSDMNTDSKVADDTIFSVRKNIIRNNRDFFPVCLNLVQ